MSMMFLKNIKNHIVSSKMIHLIISYTAIITLVNHQIFEFFNNYHSLNICLLFTSCLSIRFGTIIGSLLAINDISNFLKRNCVGVVLLTIYICIYTLHYNKIYILSLTGIITGIPIGISISYFFDQNSIHKKNFIKLYLYRYSAPISLLISSLIGYYYFNTPGLNSIFTAGTHIGMIIVITLLYRSRKSPSTKINDDILTKKPVEFKNLIRMYTSNPLIFKFIVISNFSISITFGVIFPYHLLRCAELLGSPFAYTAIILMTTLLSIFIQYQYIPEKLLAKPFSFYVISNILICICITLTFTHQNLIYLYLSIASFSFLIPPCAHFKNRMELMLIHTMDKKYLNYLKSIIFNLGQLFGNFAVYYCWLNHHYFPLLPLIITTLLATMVYTTLLFISTTKQEHPLEACFNISNKNLYHQLKKLLSLNYTFYYSGLSIFKYVYFFWFELNHKLYYYVYERVSHLIGELTTLLCIKIQDNFLNSFSLLCSYTSFQGLLIIISPLCLTPLLSIPRGFASGITECMTRSGIEYSIKQSSLFTSNNKPFSFYINLGKILGSVIILCLLWNLEYSKNIFIFALLIAGILIIISWLPLTFSKLVSGKYLAENIKQNYNLNNHLTYTGDLKKIYHHVLILKELNLYKKSTFLFLGLIYFSTAFVFEVCATYIPISLYRAGIPLTIIFTCIAMEFMIYSAVQKILAGKINYLHKTHLIIFLIVVLKGLNIIPVFTYLKYSSSYSSWHVPVIFFLFYFTSSLIILLKQTIFDTYLKVGSYQALYQYKLICRILGAMAGIIVACNCLSPESVWNIFKIIYTVLFIDILFILLFTWSKSLPQNKS